MYVTLGQLLIRYHWCQKRLGGRVHAIVLQGKGGGKLFYVVETTCCFSDEDCRRDAKLKASDVDTRSLHLLY